MDIFEVYFNHKLNIKRINKHLNKSHIREKANKFDGIRAGCVQREIKIVKSIEEYADMLHRFIKEGSEKGCDIIVFPEYNFLDLVGIFPFFDKINKSFNKKDSNENENTAINNKDNELIYSILLSASEPIQRAIEYILSFYAKMYSVYIYSGSYLLREGDYLYNCGTLISRNGEILGRQKKLHLTDYEEKIGLKKGDELLAFDLDIGRVACPICMDATYFETFKIARNLGCNIIILPIANNEKYNTYRALRGIWSRVQESFVYGFKSSLNGEVLGIKFTGKSGIFAPISLTERKDGIVSISKNYYGNSLVVADIDIKRLEFERERAQYFGDTNEIFEKDYYSKTYNRI
ncbi:nitrilase-related carbon-nitrogen hydrolase [Caloramator sp. E03]|uniref:nitrilase-related carbon-nitrogen hydrolase n=1 Tax=Caloramator sp. E03 TaxID=2576307 RepID=UPI001A9A76FF|nr:nitrilase-related carbon-nitrogen hydrolase [Caloramator sp. E03]